MRITVPNQVTLARLVLALVFFVVLALFDAATGPRWLLVVAFWVFLVAALTDVLDGQLARWLKQETAFGRVIDPVVDKVIVCGAFVFFAGPDFVHEGRNITGVAPWMVIVVVGRELLVSAVRSQAEAGGHDFAAVWAGKLKMLVQCTTVCVILWQLGWQSAALTPLRIACVWLTVVVTILSMVAYMRRAQTVLFPRPTTGVNLAPPAAGTPRREPQPSLTPKPTDDEGGARSGGMSA
jgi:CDP-diacylglycerol--glycerol-3-phosphate 3-phosphatidyltransferase